LLPRAAQAAALEIEPAAKWRGRTPKLTNSSLDVSRRSNYCDVMRYFFHIAGRSELFPDELGSSPLTLESAKRHAAVLVEELRKGGDFCASSTVRVVDEQGSTVFECPVS
jgi:hypothetical protein